MVINHVSFNSWDGPPSFQPQLFIESPYQVVRLFKEIQSLIQATRLAIGVEYDVRRWRFPVDGVNVSGLT